MKNDILVRDNTNPNLLYTRVECRPRHKLEAKLSKILRQTPPNRWTWWLCEAIVGRKYLKQVVLLLLNDWIRYLPETNPPWRLKFKVCEWIGNSLGEGGVGLFSPELVNRYSLLSMHIWTSVNIKKDPKQNPAVASPIHHVSSCLLTNLSPPPFPPPSSYRNALDLKFTPVARPSTKVPPKQLVSLAWGEKLLNAACFDDLCRGTASTSSACRLHSERLKRKKRNPYSGFNW